jgi:hypothetical protein
VFEAKGTERETPIEQSIAHLACVEMARHHKDVAAAGLHARQIEKYSERAEIAYLRVHALFATALAKTTSGDFVNSARDVRAGLDLVAQAKAAHDHEPLMLAELSYVQYRGGMVREAADTAISAIAIAQQRSRRAAECLATIVYAAANVRGNSAVANRKARDAFARAEELIHVTGAALLTPRLRELRSGSTVCRL